jgi:hypothetical protein
MQERKKLNNPAQARNSFRQMVTGLILEQPFQISSEHSLSHSEIAGDKRISRQLFVIVAAKCKFSRYFAAICRVSCAPQ